jgi:hypothetical protein
VGNIVAVASLDGSLQPNDGLVDPVIVLRGIGLCFLAASAACFICDAVSACRARLRRLGLGVRNPYLALGKVPTAAALPVRHAADAMFRQPR